MTLKEAPAPAPRQDNNNTRPPQDLVSSSVLATGINVSPTALTHVDARIGGRYVRYLNDPATGIWRTYGDEPPERISPLALTRIETGRGSNVEIEAIHPKTGGVWAFGGDIDDVATLLCRAGQAYGSRPERKPVYWAIYEFCSQARRQQAARGVAQ